MSALSMTSCVVLITCYSRIGAEPALRATQTDFEVAAIPAAQAGVPKRQHQRMFFVSFLTRSVEKCRRERPCSRVQDQP